LLEASQPFFEDAVHSIEESYHYALSSAWKLSEWPITFAKACKSPLPLCTIPPLPEGPGFPFHVPSMFRITSSLPPFTQITLVLILFFSDFQEIGSNFEKSSKPEMYLAGKTCMFEVKV
jgi:hypothetical protein